MSIEWNVPGSFDNGMNLGTIRGNINTFNTDVANWINIYQPVIDDMILDVQGMKEDIANLLVLVTALNQKVDAIYSDVEDLKNRMLVVEGDVTDLKSRVANNETNIATNAIEISNLTGRVSSNEGDIANLELDLDTVEQRVTINEQDIDNLEAMIGTFTVGEISGNNTSQTFDDTTFTDIVAYDRVSYHAGDITPDYATGTVTIVERGAYVISAGLNVSFGSAEEIEVKIAINGVTDANGSIIQGRGTGKGVLVQATIIRDLEAGDVVKLVAKNNATGNLSVEFYDCMLTLKAENLPDVSGDIPLDEYYRLDGTYPLLADFNTGGFKVVDMANGTNSTDGATYGQLNAHTVDTNNPHTVTSTQIGAYAVDGSNPLTAPLAGGGQVLSDIADGVQVTDGASVGQVSNLISNLEHADLKNTDALDLHPITSITDLDSTLADIETELTTKQDYLGLGTAGQVLATNQAADGTEWIDTGITGDSLVIDRFLGDGATQTFTPSQSFNPDTITVYLNGILLQGSSYDVSDSTNVIFNVPPDVDDEITTQIVVGVIGDFVGEAPLDGQLYGRQDANWEVIPSGGTGDMTKAVYDTNDSGVVDDSELLGGQTAAELPISTATQAALDAKANTDEVVGSVADGDLDRVAKMVSCTQAEYDAITREADCFYIIVG